MASESSLQVLVLRSSRWCGRDRNTVHKCKYQCRRRDARVVTKSNSPAGLWFEISASRFGWSRRVGFRGQRRTRAEQHVRFGNNQRSPPGWWPRIRGRSPDVRVGRGSGPRVFAKSLRSKTTSVRSITLPALQAIQMADPICQTRLANLVLNDKGRCRSHPTMRRDAVLTLCPVRRGWAWGG